MKNTSKAWLGIEMGKHAAEGFRLGLESVKYKDTTAGKAEAAEFSKLYDESFVGLFGQINVAARDLVDAALSSKWHVESSDICTIIDTDGSIAYTGTLNGGILALNEDIEQKIVDTLMHEQTQVEQELLAALKKSDDMNLQLRRANSKLKSSERHLKRVIRGYKEQLEQAQPHKHRYRNKNHQGGKRK